MPLGLGGDHGVTLAELRALARRHGPLALVHFDSHTDTWPALFRRRAAQRRHAVPARGRGGHRRARALAPDRHARLAVRGLRHQPVARARLPGADHRRGARDDARRARHAGARAHRRRAGLPDLRHGLRRSGLGAGGADARGGRPLRARGARDPARAPRPRSGRLRRGRDQPLVRRPGPDHRTPRRDVAAELLALLAESRRAQARLRSAHPPGSA